MNITKENIIGAIVAEDYRAAAIFEQSGIDFCCNGNRTIEKACQQQNILPETIIDALQQALHTPAKKEAAVSDYRSWPLDLLVDFIEKKHHRYVTAQIPLIQGLLEKISRVHGDKHPELFEIRSLFDAGAGELSEIGRAHV